MPTKQDEDLLDALKHVAAILRDGGVRFVLGGGLAAWARGGPSTEHDIDLVISSDDVDRAVQLLADADLRTERPPEGWLVKTWVGDVLVDLIFRPTGIAVDDDFFERSEVLNVHAVNMRVMSMLDVLTTKLGALTEHHLDYGPSLEYARSLREQIDWETLAARTGDSPFARAFLFLVSELGIHPVPEPAMAGGRD
ncbi:MAG TPA: nucleotidyltransferase [Acidimicrobiales bacterium]|nr:nucleotidyltransferase [Acidimicrobiales bacterium]